MGGWVGMRGKKTLFTLNGPLIFGSLFKITSNTLLDQAHAHASHARPFWGSFVLQTPRHDIGCPTPCSITNHQYQ